MNDLSSPVADTAEETATTPTLPSLNISIRGFDPPEGAQAYADAISTVVFNLAREIELATLDGVTVAADYKQALAELDRGVSTSRTLSPSDGVTIGIAMTPTVVRDGRIKSHIVLNAAYTYPILDPSHEHFNFVLHTLAHECCHVEVTAKFDQAFPSFLITSLGSDLLAALRWDTILGTWDEFAVTYMCARMGADPTEGYESTFVNFLESTQRDVYDAIRAYRIHGSVDQVLSEVFRLYGSLVKHTAYHLGNLKGHGLAIEDRPTSAAALEGHWFAPHLPRLRGLLEAIWSDYGKWTSLASSEALGDFVEDLLCGAGVFPERQADGRLYVRIPFRPETI